jgi:hypothetical protein
MASGNSIYDHVRSWCREGATEAEVARALVNILDVASAAEAAIRASAWGEEAQQGLLQITGQIRAAFVPHGCSQPASNFFPTLDSSITMFAILSSAAGLPGVGGDQPAQVKELLADIDALVATIDAAGLDPLVHETAMRHLRALDALLRNIDAFGVDGAMAAYFELVVRLKRVEKAATPSTVAKLAKIWPEIERWAGRLAIIDEAINHGQGLLKHVDMLVKLLPGTGG